MRIKHWKTKGAFALLLLATLPARAQDSDNDSGLPNFTGLRGSLALSTSVKGTIPTTPPTELRGSFAVGGGGSIYIGTRLPDGFSAELEGLYRNQPIASAAVNGTAVTANGYGEMFAPMANVYWDLPVPGIAFQPFVGAGVGMAWTETSLHSLAGLAPTTYLHSDTWHFAQNVMAGVEIPISESTRFTAMYRWLNANSSFECGISGTATNRCKSDFDNSSIDIGFKWDMP